MSCRPLHASRGDNSDFKTVMILMPHHADCAYLVDAPRLTGPSFCNNEPGC